nr:hypothetical protein [uncultured Pseudomonas sp.]
MRAINLYAIFFILFSPISHAEFAYIEINEKVSVPISKQCPGNTGILKLSEGGITIASDVGSAYRLLLDWLPENTELIMGHSSISSSCTLAVAYAKNDVNESYSLFVYSQESRRFIPSQISTITNPDFSGGRILSNYRDASLVHNDTLCFSERLGDYFVCERREQFHNSLEKLEICDDRLCSTPYIVKAGSQDHAIGIITEKKTFFYDRVGEEEFSQRKGYLIKGDKAYLSDYVQTRDGLYYNVTFLGKKTVTGWIRSKAIDIDG